MLLRWIGKGRTPRKAVPGPELLRVLDEYRRRYEAALNRPVTPDDPILCPLGHGTRGGVRNNQPVEWGRPIKYGRTIWKAVTRRAAAANLGHVAPHDLRRSMAGLLHKERDERGNHRFDLTDIQQALGHVSPDTTVRSYLQPLDNDVLEMAVPLLDM